MKNPDAGLVFVTVAEAPARFPYIRTLVESLRSFGGPLARAPVWLFVPDVDADPEDDGVRTIPLDVPESMAGCPSAAKVAACAAAETRCGPGVRSLVWIDPCCLVVAPPVLLDLGEDADAAVRPVHLANVGLPADVPIDPFWQVVCAAVGTGEVATTVESFVDCCRLRAYFNTHAIAVRPSQGVFRRWMACFASLTRDGAFLAGPCADERHRIFLHQAVLSALVATMLAPSRVRLLPPACSYPYNLQASVPAGRRARSLEELVTLVYEERSLDPARVDDIAIGEPLQRWLAEHAP